MSARTKPVSTAVVCAQPSYAQLTDEQRANLRRCIYEKLRSSQAGYTTVGVFHSVMYLDRFMKFRPTLSNVVDALCAMVEDGAVHRHDGLQTTTWAAIKRPAQSSLTR